MAEEDGTAGAVRPLQDALLECRSRQQAARPAHK